MEVFAILVPLAPFLMVCFIVWTKHQRKMAELQVKATAETAAQYASHTTELEERVRVLERVHATSKTLELVGRRKQGDEFPLELSVTSWKGKSDLFFTIIMRDISERRTAEEQRSFLAECAERGRLADLYDRAQAQRGDTRRAARV